MPADRAEDSYRIYSSLMPLGETAGKNWPRELWLVRDITVTIVSSDLPCQPDSKSVDASSMNPHVAIHPTDDHREDFDEILQDFDKHCHDPIRLDPNAWKLPVPVRLLNSKQQAEFGTTRGFPERNAEDNYKGAPALYGFSEVYFNAKHTVALVYATHYCGSLCGEGFWIALALEGGEWKRLRWKTNGWIS